MKKLVEGMTLSHEHIVIDLSGIKGIDDCNFNNKAQIIKEFKELYKFGIRNIIDQTLVGMGRNIDYLLDVEKQTGINIITGTGFYTENFMPDVARNGSVEDIANFMREELNKGIMGTDLRASYIGEIGTSLNKMTDTEKKVFEAACIVQKETGVNIMTHATLGTYGHEQIDFFQERGVDLGKVLIGHTDLTGDYEYIKSLLERGVCVGFDTIGKLNYMVDSTRVEILEKLIKDGYKNKVLLSLDITRKSNLKDEGGIGYAYIFEEFFPMFEKTSVSKEVLMEMLRNNPKEFFNGK